MTVYGRMTGEQRLTTDELRALQIVAERGWGEVKREGERAVPYGPPRLTDRAIHAVVGALEKIDAVLREAQEREACSDAGTPPPLVMREEQFTIRKRP